MNSVVAVIGRKLSRLGGLALALALVPWLAQSPGLINEVRADEEQVGEVSEEAEARRTQRVPAMREQAFNRLSEAQEALDEGDTEEALRVLQRMSEQRGLNAYEAASMENMRAYIHFSQENYADAIRAYEAVLSYSPEVPLALELGTMYALGQLYFVQEDYEKAIEYLNQWFDLVETPSAQAYVFLAQAHYQLNNYREVIPAVQSAMELAERRGNEIRENWWLLKRAAYYELEDWDNVIAVLEVLVEKFPSRDYWVQLSGLQGQQGNEKEQIGAIWAAYIQGFLDREREILNLTGLLQQVGAPFWAAQILEAEIDSGVVEASYSNLRSLGQAWQISHNAGRAIDAYTRAAERSDDGEMHYRIAQLELDRDNCEASVQAANRALSRGGLDRPAQAHLVKGMCEYNLRRFEDAVATLGAGVRAARQDGNEQDERALAQWRQFVEREKQREEALARASG